MTKRDLVKAISEELGLQQNEVAGVIEALLVHIRIAYQNNDRIEIRGFGSFIPTIKAAHIGNDIARGKPVMIPAHKYLKFKMSPLFCPEKKDND